MKQLKLLLLLISFAYISNVAGQTVYTTKTGEKYHKSSCRYLKYSKKETTINKAKAAGYSACGVCKPTLANTENNTNANSLTTTTMQKAVPTKKAVSSQCTGRTKAGNRCKRMTKNANGRCYQHQS